jgi:hypothetical protein
MPPSIIRAPTADDRVRAAAIDDLDALRVVMPTFPGLAKPLAFR